MAYFSTEPASERRNLTGKNRVWDFFRLSNETHPANRRQPLQPRRKIGPTAMKTASGIPCWPSRDPIEEEGGESLYGFVVNDGVNRIDGLGDRLINVSHDNMQTILSTYNVYAYTGDISSILSGIAYANKTGTHDIREDNGKCCAWVVSAAKIQANVYTIYPYQRSMAGFKYSVTRRGYQAIVAHEGRRQYAYNVAYKRDLAPISEKGRRALRCGKICRSKSGEAKELLEQYLDENQRKAMEEFDAFQDKWQRKIGITENPETNWKTQAGKFNGFKTIVTVGDPSVIEWEPCPSAE